MQVDHRMATVRGSTLVVQIMGSVVAVVRRPKCVSREDEFQHDRR